MELLKRHMSWMSYVSIGSKVGIGVLIWLGLSLRDATLLVAAPIVFLCYKIFRTGIKEQYWMPIEELHEHIKEDSKTWVFIANHQEGSTSVNPAPSSPSKLPSTPGHSVAPSPAVPSAFLPIPKHTLFR